MRHCIEDQPEYPFWKDALNTYLGVMGKAEYRTRFVARCMRGHGCAAMEIKNINRITQTFLDFKWEFVENLMYWVVVGHPSYKRFWHSERYAGDFSEEEVKLLERVRSDPVWFGISLVVLSISTAVGRESRKLAGHPLEADAEDMPELLAKTKSGKHRQRGRGVTAQDERMQSHRFGKGGGPLYTLWVRATECANG